MQSSQQFIRMLKKLNKDLSSIKKTRSEIKDTLIEVRNNLQEKNSRVDKAQNQINHMEHKEAKTNRSELQEEKRIPKYVVSVSSPWDNFNRSTIPHHRGARRRRERARNLEIYLKK